MFKPTTYRGNNFNSFRIMLHLQQTRLCLLFLFKTPSKSQHVSYRPEVFLYSRCEYCCTFSVGVIFYQQVEGWVLFFFKRKRGASARNMSGELLLLNNYGIQPFGSSAAQTTEFSYISYGFLHLFSFEWSAEISRNAFIAHFHTTQPAEGKRFEIYNCLEILGQVGIVTFPIHLCMNRAVGQLKCNWI